MIDDRGPSILERIRPRFRQIVEDEHLLDAGVSVLAKPLTPDEAIGTPGRRDFPILIGKERILEASFLGARGHAFTDSAREFEGTLAEVLELKLSSNQSRAIYVAALNAVLGRLGMMSATVHCKDDDPEKCGAEIARHIRDTHGKVDVGLIGLNPAIAENLVDVFTADHVRISDLDRDNIGKARFGVEVWHGDRRTDDLVEACDVILFTGTTLQNGTFDRIRRSIQAHGKSLLVYGVTAAGVCALCNIDRICPCGRDS